MIKNIIFGVLFFIGIDYGLSKYKIEGRYYANHAICNSAVIINTININNLYNAKTIIYSLHIYHIIWYFKKLRKDDWIHHLLMIGIVLPLTETVEQKYIISHGLFFTTGLPGLIDYILLFLNRNNLLNIYYEKKINTFINLWIRAPGCIMNTTMSLIILHNNYNKLSIYQLYGGIIMSSLMYWNGIYFMSQTINNFNLYKYNHNYL